MTQKDHKKTYPVNTVETMNSTGTTKDQGNVAVKDLKKAVVIYNTSKQTPCNTLLKVGDVLLEPMHELQPDFLHDQLPVWIQYHPQRRMSRCGNTQPVEILFIKKRTE